MNKLIKQALQQHASKAKLSMIDMGAAALCAAAWLGSLGMAAAADVKQDYPTKPIRIVVAQAVGSGADVVARLLAPRLTQAWGQQLIVDNRAGAAGVIGAEMVSRATPDGYTLWLVTMSQLVSTVVHRRYVIGKSFAPVSMLASTPYIIAVSASLPVNTIAELIAYAKARPGQVLYGSAGAGSTSHLCFESLKLMTGIDMPHIAYKSTPQALTEMYTAQVHATCAASPAMPPFIKLGKIRALAVTAQAPTPLAPGLVTVAATVPGFELMGWYGLLAPLNTPKTIIDVVNAEVTKALASQEMRERLIATGAEAKSSTPSEFGAFLLNETLRWEKVIAQAGIKPGD